MNINLESENSFATTNAANRILCVPGNITSSRGHPDRMRSISGQVVDRF